MKITVNNCQIELTPEQLAQIDAEVKRNQTPPKPSKEERFWGLINETVLKIDKVKYPNSIFGFKGEEWWWEYDSKSGYLWLRWYFIWSIFESEYSLDYNDIQSFIKEQVETHFNCKCVTPMLKKWGLTPW